MDIEFAPLQGYVDNAYRRLHAEIYGGVDMYYTPFIRVEKGEARRQDIARLEASYDDGTPLTPQIIFKDVDEFRLLVDAVKSKGCDRIDINLGCPYPMQTRKGRGAAMITNIETMSHVAELISADTEATYSVKMRLGLNDPDEWRALMPILNSLRLNHITMHPRTARQMYGGEMHPDEFADFLALSTNPVIWNGDIHTAEDIDMIVSSHPTLKGVMIGRGLLARPSLATEWRNGSPYDDATRKRLLLDFHNQLFDEYRETLCGQAQILQKIKPFWEYLEPEIGHKPYKAINKATTLDKYIAAIALID